MEVNQLIERYGHEVGQHLPRRMRDDIIMELNSLIRDALDERSADLGYEPTAEMAADILREMGKPEDMAASYLPEQYLIGPHLFPIYKLVITIVLAILGVFFLLVAGFSLFNSETAEIGRKIIGYRFWFLDDSIDQSGHHHLDFCRHRVRDPPKKRRRCGNVSRPGRLESIRPAQS